MSDVLEDVFEAEQEVSLETINENQSNSYIKKTAEGTSAYYKQVATNMRQARRKLNLTQVQVAEMMEMPRSTYKSIESGTVQIYGYHMARWSYVVGLDIRILTRNTIFDLSNRRERHELLRLIDALPQIKYEAIIEILKD